MCSSTCFVACSLRFALQKFLAVQKKSETQRSNFFSSTSSTCCCLPDKTMVSDGNVTGCSHHLHSEVFVNAADAPAFCLTENRLRTMTGATNTKANDLWCTGGFKQIKHLLTAFLVQGQRPAVFHILPGAETGCVGLPVLPSIIFHPQTARSSPSIVGPKRNAH